MSGINYAARVAAMQNNMTTVLVEYYQPSVSTTNTLSVGGYDVEEVFTAPIAFNLQKDDLVVICVSDKYIIGTVKRADQVKKINESDYRPYSPIVQKVNTDLYETIVAQNEKLENVLRLAQLYEDSVKLNKSLDQLFVQQPHLKEAFRDIITFNTPENKEPEIQPEAGAEDDEQQTH